MLASDMIEKLEELIEIYGDLDVFLYDVEENLVEAIDLELMHDTSGVKYFEVIGADA